MANVSSVSDIKKAIQNKERVLVATNKKTELILLAASKLPAATFVASTTVAAIQGIAAGAISTAMGLMSLTNGQVWVIIATIGLISLIGMLRAKNARIVVENGRFIVEYEGMGKR